MHVLLSILGIIGSVGVLLWHIRMAGDAANEMAEAGNDARLFFRRLSWRRKANFDPLKTISDPREAAAAMMVAVAQYDGATTQDEETLILQLMAHHFEIASPETDEQLSLARWRSRDATNLSQFLRRLTPAIKQHCTPIERRDLIGMLLAVASVHGEPGQVEFDAIAKLRRRLGVA